MTILRPEEALYSPQSWNDDNVSVEQKTTFANLVVNALSKEVQYEENALNQRLISQLPKKGDIAVFMNGEQKEVFEASIYKTPQPFSTTYMKIKFYLVREGGVSFPRSFSDSFLVDGTDPVDPNNSILYFVSPGDIESASK